MVGRYIMASMEIVLRGVSHTKQLLQREFTNAREFEARAPRTLTERLALYMRQEAPVYTGHLKSKIFAVAEKTGSARVETRTYLPHAKRRGGPLVSRRGYAKYVQWGTRGFWGPKPSSKGWASRALIKLEQDIDREVNEYARRK